MALKACPESGFSLMKSTLRSCDCGRQTSVSLGEMSPFQLAVWADRGFPIGTSLEHPSLAFGLTLLGPVSCGGHPPTQTHHPESQ